MATKMTLSPALLKPLIVNSSGQIFVSKRITTAVQSCITTSVTEIETQADKLKKIYDDQKNASRIKINYDDPAVLDAYTIKYLPRNTLVPKLGLLYCSYHPSMLPVTDQLKILDLASGTGAIPLGLLDLVQNPSLNRIKCDIYALDASAHALAKQKKLIDTFGLGGSSHTSDQVDFTDSTTYEKLLASRAPFDFIFSANLLSELKPEFRKNILEIIRNNLTDDGVCIIAESQNMPAKTACAYVSQNATKYGLNIFFPCPPGIECENSDCWKWFNHDFDCDDIKVDNKYIEVTKIHKVFWRVITKQPLSIYEYLNAHKSNTNWGITRRDPRNGNEFCTTNGQFSATVKPPLPYNGIQDPWSQMIGTSANDERIRVKWDPINNFGNCKCEIEKE